MSGLTTQAVELSNDVLGDLPAGIERPRYDRTSLTPGIVHIGLGNFHRAHQAWFTHRLMQDGFAHDWAILGAGVRAFDVAQRERLKAQDCLTTLIELAPNARSAEITGSMIDYIAVEEGNAPLIEAMANPEIRIVSLTVTEGGYFTHPSTGAFDAQNDEIQHDIAHPDRPVTAFGAIIAALRLRQSRGIGPFTALSCDNVQGNGDILRQTVLGLANLIDPALAAWIEDQCSFPNSMVDCIVPATGPKELALVREFGIEDSAPVSHENFRQWVIEDDFCAGRPDWDRVGATFVKDVHDYEVMKLRFVNGGHQLVANVGELLSHETISGCMADDRIRAFFLRTAREEIAPHVAPVPGMTPTNYIDLIERRFANPAIVDTVRRVAFDGSSRHPGFVLPIIADGLAKGMPIKGLALVEAAWARMCEGTREDGTSIEANDPDWSMLQDAAKAARNHPKAWLERLDRIYGEIGSNPAFVSAFEMWLPLVYEKGIAAAIDTYLES